MQLPCSSRRQQGLWEGPWQRLLSSFLSRLSLLHMQQTSARLLAPPHELSEWLHPLPAVPLERWPPLWRGSSSTRRHWQPRAAAAVDCRRTAAAASAVGAGSQPVGVSATIPIPSPQRTDRVCNLTGPALHCVFHCLSFTCCCHLSSAAASTMARFVNTGLQCEPYRYMSHRVYCYWHSLP